MKQRVRQIISWLVLAVLVVLATPLSATAATFTPRKLTLVAGATDGGSKPGGVVKHLFDYTVPAGAGGSVGSIKYLYCTSATGTCTTPTGLVTTSATLGAQSGATGFTIVNTTNGSPYLTRAAAAIAASTALQYRLDSITNPTAANQTFFVRISYYTSTDTTGSPIDSGVVTASTATQIILTGTMPESLVFCTGGTVSTTGGVPDCATATSGAVSFNQEFSPTNTATATSQMAASTNAGSGYSITVNGTTLTSGANTITAMSAAGVGVRNSSQFGTNLRANTVATSTPIIGTDVAPAANGTSLRGTAQTGYATVDQFKFVTGDVVADSSNGGLGPTDAQIFTSSYIVNVKGSQPAGTYTSTLTYICTATF